MQKMAEHFQSEEPVGHTVQPPKNPGFHPYQIPFFNGILVKVTFENFPTLIECLPFLLLFV